MNRRSRVGVVAAFAVIAVAVGFASPVRAADDDLTVNYGSVVNDIQHAWLGVNYVAFWDSLQGSTASRNAMMNAGIELIRFPGGVPGEWIDWDDPYGGGWSSTSTMDLWNYAQGVGPNVRLMLQTNPTDNVCGGGQPNDSSGTHAADWVTYCDNNNIDVPYWEIGNEEDMESGLTQDYQWSAYQWYLDKFGEHATAMKARNGSIDILGNVGTNAWYWWGLHSLDMFMQTHGNIYGTGLVDIVSLHWYPAPSWPGWETVRANGQAWQSNYDYIRSCIQDNDTRNLDLFISETNAAVGVDGGDMAKTMACAISNSDMMGAMAESGVQAVQLFGCIHILDNNWGFLATSGESQPAETQSCWYYILPIWSKLGRTVLSVSGETDPSTTTSAYAFKDPSGNAQVLIHNKTSSSRSVQVSFNGFDPTGQGVQIYEIRPSSAGDVWDFRCYYNGNYWPNPTTTSPLPVPMADTCSGSSYTRTVPAYSVTMLNFGGTTQPAPPVANDDVYSTEQDVALNVSAPGVLANDYDPDGDPIHAIKVSDPSHGSVNLSSDGSFAYTPDSAYKGEDSFTYKANDSDEGDSNVATVSITVSGQAPYGGTPWAIPGTIEAEDYDEGGEGIAYHDTDTGNSGGQYRTSEGVDVETCGEGGYNVGWINTDEWIEYTVNVGSTASYDIEARVASESAGGTLHIEFGGTDKTGPITVPVTGGWQTWTSVNVTDVSLNAGQHIMRIGMDSAGFNVNYVTITGGAANDPPVANNDSYSTNEDQTLNVSVPGVLGNDSDPNEDPLTAIKVSDPSHGSVTLNSNGSFSYTPDANYNGSDSFTYKANDGQADSNTATVNITVDAVNDPPVASNDSYSTDEDQTLNVSAPGVLGNDSDVEDDPLSAVKVSDPSHGSVTLNSNGSFSYTPDAGYSGSDWFTYKANDGTADSNTATVNITITADAPPAAPTGLTATPGDGQVSLDWNDNSEPDLANYRVYRSTTSGSGYGQIASPSSSAYTDNGVANGTTYYYVVTVVDAGSNESGYSGEVSATPASAGAGTGLKGEYYDNMDFTSLAVTRVDPTVGFDWGSGAPDPSMGADTFSVRWTGKIEPLYSETYTFRTYTDDGIRLWVDSQLVVENWTDHGPTSNTGTISLTAAVQYDIQLDFYENGGGAVCQLYWSSASQSEEIVPQSQLYEPVGDTTPPADPTGLSATPGDGQVSLDWADNSEPDLSGYRVYRSTTSGSGYSQIASPGSSAYTDSGVTNGTTYYYVVTAVDTASNESGYSNEASATPTDSTPPAAPSGLSATAGDGQVSLDWNDNSEPDLANYRVYRSTTSGSGYSQIASPGSSAYTDSGVTNGTTYYYVVTALDTASNESGYSNEASATPQAGVGGTTTYNFAGVTQSTPGYDAYACDVDVFPFGGSTSNRNSQVEATDTQYGNISADNTAQWATADPGSRDEILLWLEMEIDEPVGNITQIDLTFNGNTDGSSATEHRIYVMTAGANWAQSASWTQVGTGQSIPQDVDTTMTRSITSNIGNYIDGSGKIVWGVYETRSSEDLRINYVEMVVHYSGTPDTTPPADPTGLGATAGDAQVSVDWNDNGEGDLDGYRVYRSTTSGSGYGQIADVSSSSHTDTGVSNGTTYYYVVTAYDTSDNESGYSNEASATPQGDTTPPADPTGLGATAGDAQVSLDWNDNGEGDLDGYRVYRSTTSGSGYGQIADVSSSAHTDSGVSNGTTYYYVVTAYDTSDNESGYSNEASATPQGDTTPPAAPTGLGATAGDGEVDLDWNDNTEGDLSGYRVYRSTTSGSGYSQIASPSSSACTDTGVTNGTTYYYVVTAVDTSSNESGYSNEASATPQDVTAPAAPTGLTATAGDGQVSLDWNDNGEPDLDSYRVYRSTTSGSGHSQIASPSASSHTDSGLTNGTTYYYVVTAVDTASNESGYSSEASATPQSGGGAVFQEGDFPSIQDSATFTAGTTPLEVVITHSHENPDNIAVREPTGGNPDAWLQLGAYRSISWIGLTSPAGGQEWAISFDWKYDPSTGWMEPKFQVVGMTNGQTRNAPAGINAPTGDGVVLHQTVLPESQPTWVDSSRNLTIPAGYDVILLEWWTDAAASGEYGVDNVSVTTGG